MHSRTKRMRGMRDLTTIQGLSGRKVPDSREQIVAEQARQEHERSRLEREQALWQGNLDRTNERLKAVQDRLALLSSALEPTRTAQPTDGSPAAPRIHGGGEALPERVSWHAIVLEY